MHINDFPTELLEEIFLRSISRPPGRLSFFLRPSDPPEPLPSPPFTCCSSSPANPCLISGICKRWQGIALNFAPLWTHLHVVDPQDISIVQDLEVWMHRAGNLPLCFSLRQCNSYNLEANVAVVTLFLKSLQRCQSIEMFLRTAHISLENIERVPSTSLESVNVWCRGQWGREDAPLLTNLLLNTRSLRTIRWSCALRCPHDTIPHPWESLRELSTDNVGSLHEFLNALSHCQNLECLKILAKSYERSPPLKPIPVILPRVTHLSVVFQSRDTNVRPATIAILSQLVLPSLEELELLPWFKVTRLTPILDLLQRSGVVLRRFRIISGRSDMGYLIYQQELIRILKTPYFQELRILEAEEPMVAGCDIARFLTLATHSNTAGSEEDDGTPGYLAHLERICLVFQDTGAVKITRILQKLVESRLGIMSDPKSARWHIKILGQTYFSLSIPPV